MEQAYFFDKQWWWWWVIAGKKSAKKHCAKNAFLGLDASCVSRAPDHYHTMDMGSVVAFFKCENTLRVCAQSCHYDVGLVLTSFEQASSRLWHYSEIYVLSIMYPTLQKAFLLSFWQTWRRIEKVLELDLNIKPLSLKEEAPLELLSRFEIA